MNSYWIWNYGDYEIYHSNLANSRRQEYGADYPVFWRMYDVERNVKFFAEPEIEKPGTLVLHVCGIGYILIDGERYRSNQTIEISAGKHQMSICVTNLSGLPAAYIESDVCTTGGSWYTFDGYGNKIGAGFETKHDRPEKTPEVFPFLYKRVLPEERSAQNGGVLFDFGKELFGHLLIDNVKSADRLHVSYGESREEALDTKYSILFEDVSGAESYKLRQRAFRYIFIEGCPEVTVSADYEYLPHERRGAFECSEASVNKIWDMCAYTLELTAREVMLEAIKRDRWLWGGDAYQAYKFCNFLFHDKEIVRRSTIALRGKEPFIEHINTITDYSFYWVIGLYEYYREYKDYDFIKFIYPRAVSLMEFSAKRVNDDGFITGMPGDWIFIDWADMDKEGAVCAEQMLYIAANRTMARLAEILGEDGKGYAKIADELTEKVNRFFWNSEKEAFIDSYQSGKNNVTRHANIFAVMYDIATEQQVQSIRSNVLLNNSIPQITTPYFEGYELDVMGKIGNFEYIENKIRTYWKGMLDLGATTVWEEYNPELSGAEHYQMYGNRYGKSLCHAWGAAPIYLFGKYYLGVSVTADGGEAFEVRPYRGGFEYIKGTVPLCGGRVDVFLSADKLCVTATVSGGTLIWNGKEYKLEKDCELALSV